MNPCYKPATQKCCGSGKEGAAEECELGVPAGVDLMYESEGIRWVSGNAFGCGADVDG